MRKPHLLEGRGYVLSSYMWGNMYLHYASGDWDCLVSQTLINLCLQDYTDELLLFTTKWYGLRTLFLLLDWKSLSTFCACSVYLVCVLCDEKYSLCKYLLCKSFPSLWIYLCCPGLTPACNWAPQIFLLNPPDGMGGRREKWENL